MLCKNCGREMQDGFEFCPLCGTRTGLMSNNDAHMQYSQNEHYRSQYDGNQYQGSQYQRSQYDENQYQRSQYDGNQYKRSQYDGTPYHGNQYQRQNSLGQELGRNVESSASGPDKSRKMDRKTLYLLIAAAAVLAAIIGVVIYLFLDSDSDSGSSSSGSKSSSSSPEKVIEDMVNAINEQDGEFIYSTLIPDEMIEAAAKSEGLSESELIEYAAEEFEEYQYVFVISDYEILSEVVLSKSEIREVETYCEEELDCEMDIKEAKILTVEMRADGEWNEWDFNVFKIGSKWYLWPDSLSPFW